MDRLEKVIKGLECCMGEGQCCGMCDNCPYNTDKMRCDLAALHQEALELLKAKKAKKAKKPDMKCNMCKHYQGVHGVAGHAPCAFWKIGGVLWNDMACNRFEKYVDGSVK